MAENEKIINLLRELVEIESPSKKEDKIIIFVRDYLKNLGYDVVVGKNYIATKSNSDIIVATHLDTVPIREKYSDDGEYAYGTGVCDAKGSVAAMLLAAENNLDYTLVFLCDEEEDGLGSKEFINCWDQGKYAIIMEPSDLKIASKHWGNFELTVRVQGKQAHGSLPEKGVNAIDKAWELYNKLKGLNLNINPLKISGGSEEYVIPDHCVIKFEFFLKPEEKFSNYVDKFKFLKNFGEYEIDHVYEGCISGKVTHYLEQALIDAKLPVRYTTIKSWTDALNLKEKFDVVVWGPGELYLCHTKEERIKIKDIKKASEVLVCLNQCRL
ncbi:M20/M25/M40 family metallo-hydrolase [Desulfothermus naphthae]